jgi:hypothetical protein
VIIHADSLKTLGLLKLRKIENGDVHLQTSQICLEDTIDWGAIMNRNNSIRVIKQSTRENCSKFSFSTFKPGLTLFTLKFSKKSL